MQKRETCVDCGAQSPEISTDHTLTSSLGWRLMRKKAPDGTWHAQWRCGKCWSEHKAKAQYSAEITRVRVSTGAPARVVESKTTLNPKVSWTSPSGEKQPSLTIAPNSRTPTSLAAPSGPLMRRSR